ncbi:glycosyltransferase [Morganella psychrotolerans]|uniref:Glycosyltransferase n=2 Tax=Morganella psychrotolerans TaxID=368603 RepID=A0A5M9QZF9_9GAMM|nr:glycosyltransferase [Morganella psychrotolerans]KAA8713242.1 glycosyltransferase [Morganella psychrotolerans]
MKFSILLSVYFKENAIFLNDSLNRIINNSEKPTEVVIVKDGPLTDQLNLTIENWEKEYPNIIKTIDLPENIGLGKALNEGIKHCSNEWIFRMDTDDICLPNRFKKQINYLQENPHISLLGGNIEEFNEDMTESNGQRNIAIEHNNILKLAKKRNPFNHVTVAFKKSAVLAVGGYQHHLYMEDYNLWIRMISSDYKTHNLQDVLVNVRAGTIMVSRRRGLKYIKSELQLAKLKIKLKIDTPLSATLIFAMRSIPRLLPTSILNIIYKKLRK